MRIVFKTPTPSDVYLDRKHELDRFDIVCQNILYQRLAETFDWMNFAFFHQSREILSVTQLLGGPDMPHVYLFLQLHVPCDPL